MTTKESSALRLDDGYTLAARKLVMYADLGPANRLFGGALLSWIDEVAAIAAAQIMGTHSVVTKRVSEVVFDAPGLLGDIVEIGTRSVREGRTSLTLHCRVVGRRDDGNTVVPICTCEIVYVAIDAAGRAVPWGRPGGK